MATTTCRCTVCNLESSEEFTCRGCRDSIHYICALGFDPPAQLKSSPDKQEYLCPLCIAGSTYDLLHRALDAHQREWNPQREWNSQQEWDSHNNAESARSASPIPQQHVASYPIIPSVSPIHHHEGSEAANHHTVISSSSDVSEGPLDRGINNESGRNTRLPIHAEASAPIHPNCEAKAKKMFSNLNNPKTIPKKVSTLILGDSLVRCINKQDLDCSDTLKLIGIGGLCIAGLASGLKQRKLPFGGVKRVILSIGVNDILHRENHCADDTLHHLRAMGKEIKRVFPKALVFFVLPYKGISKVSSEDRNDLEKLVKTKCRNFRVFSSPSLVDKISVGGVHPSKQGAKLLTAFYRKLVPVPPRIFSQDSGRRSKSSSYATAVVSPPVSDPQVVQRQQANRPPPPGPPVWLGHAGHPPDTAPNRYEFPTNRGHSQHLAWDIAAAVSSALQRDYRLMYPQ